MNTRSKGSRVAKEEPQRPGRSEENTRGRDNSPVSTLPSPTTSILIEEANSKRLTEMESRFDRLEKLLEDRLPQIVKAEHAATTNAFGPNEATQETQFQHVC